MTIQNVKSNITGMLHGQTLNKVRSFEEACERAANNVLAQIDPVDTMRTVPLTVAIHDDLNNYPLPSDYRNLIDLHPQDNRDSLDVSGRRGVEEFDSRRVIDNKMFSIEGEGGDKFIRINWKDNDSLTFNTMDSLTANGTIAVVGSASGLKLNTLYKLSGSASVEFDLTATGDGIQITGANQVDLTDWDEYADVIIPVYIGDTTNLTSITAIWGNDLTANYWTGVAQTAQADGTAFKIGWNYIKVPWSTATETGTVVPSTIDSFKLTVQATGTISNIRVDNIIFSLGRLFDIVYQSKYMFKSSAGTWLSKPTSDSDDVVLDNDGMNIFLYELLDACAQQIQGEDSSFDIKYAQKKLFGDPEGTTFNDRLGLYSLYRSIYPKQTKIKVDKWSRGPRFRR